jgi:DNA polymerase elongation subunit (family B)
VYTLCTSEANLLERVIEYFELGNFPDILTGWNTDFFDFQYLINRIINILGEETVKRLSPVKSLWCREGIFVKGQQLDKWYIHGIALMDYLEIYRTFARNLLESYSLNFVAEHELGEGKLAINTTNLAALADTDWSKFVDYNIQDVDLLVRMENKLQFFKIIRMLAYKGLTSFESALGKVSIVTGCVALEAYKHNMVIPTFVEGPTREEIKGGFVRDPERGLQKSIVSYDANSLYPNTIITLNISPETKIGKIIGKDDKNVTILLTSNKEYTISNEKFIQFVGTEKIAISKANVLYSQKKKGIVPSLIDSLYNERVSNRKQFVEYKKQLTKLTPNTDEYKECKAKMERADSIQHVIKILLNSIYGVFANKFSPICDSDHAGSITLTGQAVVKQASEIIDQYAKEKFNYTGKSLTIYNDTDSTHVTIDPILTALGLNIYNKNKINSEGLKFIDEELGTYLNNGIKDWAIKSLNSVDPRYFFKRESICDVGVYLEKKRYIIHVLNDEGADVSKFKYVGVEIARSTTPKKAKELIKKVIEDSLLGQNQNNANNIYREVYNVFKKLSTDDIAIRGGLSDIEKYETKSEGFKIAKGTPNHVKGALWYNQLLKHRKLDVKYEKIISGGKVKKIYISPNKYNIDTLCYTGTFPSELNDFEVDYEEMFNTIIKPPVEAVYTALGWHLPHVNNEAQTDLVDLFS